MIYNFNLIYFKIYFFFIISLSTSQLNKISGANVNQPLSPSIIIWHVSKLYYYISYLNYNLRYVSKSNEDILLMGRITPPETFAWEVQSRLRDADRSRGIIT